MHLHSFYVLPLFCLLLAPSPGAAEPAEELPSGTTFRDRMLSWSASAPAPVPEPTRQKAARVTLPRLSSRFGYRRHPIRGTQAMHSGIDIPGPPGTPIQASGSGFVRFAGSAGGYGKMIEIDHGNGLSTRYAHLSRILVRSGAGVAQGQTIAVMGSTGRSTGRHLHFEVRANGRAADPLQFLSTMASPPAVRYTPPAPHISQFARSRAAGPAFGDGLLASIANPP